ncbi:DUF2141 domain-containing protein [Marivirga salinae]|uniref:DUF2141 domain-containing protein n=1 Tax=Marivirga salinarum TaxID=3059078 RepID=A0AA49GC26_9BACT|nr:DUF2141 domain-containing protein [Marivirga sp. BDSF4-3]WKK74820.2 DUF2141 domain-containing protein [Marivirga sp. BDSF4-3]
MILSQYLIILFSFIVQPSSPTLELEIGEFRNTKGHVLISIFDNANDYPENGEKAFVNKKIKVTQKTHTITIEDLPQGEYAVVFLHDENDNEEMDTNFVGAPEEGYGASNDAVNTFSAPKYEEAKFLLEGEKKSLKLKIFY